MQTIDAWLELGQADEELIAHLEKLRPFGLQNRTPVWAARGVTVVGPPRIVGKKHLKFPVAAGSTQRECIGFGMSDRELPDGPMDIAFQLK